MDIALLNMALQRKQEKEHDWRDKQCATCGWWKPEICRLLPKDFLAKSSNDACPMWAKR